MRFFCDLHIHSRFSRATSSSLTIPELSRGAIRKGIRVIGTGDLTHPSWMKEIEEELIEAEPGLYRLRSQAEETRFILTGEISTIYKQAGKVRKVHHVICAPDIASAKRIGASLAKVGNILSDGRPIIGITSRNLLEIVLESSPEAFLIPAHIWTPWFSALGSKSGFDTIKDCYLDLEPHIFAVETGLSSDPLMNWMVSSLDRYSLVSNSDAHSAEKLGREATVFDCSLDYHEIRRSLATGDGLLGTVEFFPEEGKYHLDGHRDCCVVVMPEEARRHNGLCPKCGKPLTIGVLSRVEELADRHEGERPPGARPYYSLIPLAEILSEIMQVNSPTKKVMEQCRNLAGRLGGELPLLIDTDLDEIRSVAGETLALAVRRMRSGEVHKEAGYDGKFGRVRVFLDNEQDMLFAGGIIDVPARKRRAARGKKEEVRAETSYQHMLPDSEQMKAVEWSQGPLAVIAGPGTGKTRIMVERIKRLLNASETPILAVTFTTRAAQEIRERLGLAAVGQMPEPHSGPDGTTYPTNTDANPEGRELNAHCLVVSTFHSLAAAIMHDAGMLFEIADDAMLEQVAAPAMGTILKSWVEDLLLRQSTEQVLGPEQSALLSTLKARGLFTYEGLIEEATRIVLSGQSAKKWLHVMVDEFQDINPLQYSFFRALSVGAMSTMVIGDPNQAIYGFRGSSSASIEHYRNDNPGCTTVTLRETHRLSNQIASAANRFTGDDRIKASRDASKVRLVRTDRPHDFIAREIESLAGGLSHSGVKKAKAEFALSDMAVIVRTRGQAQPVLEALARASIPCDTAYARPMAQVSGIRDRMEVLSGKGWERLVRGVGDKALERIHAGMRNAGGLQQKIDQAAELIEGLSGSIVERLERLDSSGLFKLTHLDPLDPFYQYARLFVDDVQGFMEFLLLSNDQGALGTEKVHVITAHAAKGLEFRCVFLAGLIQGVFPMEGSTPKEERNLFYVGMTRAKDLLYLVCPQKGVSEFAGQLPPECLEEIEVKQAKPRSGQMVLFD